MDIKLIFGQVILLVLAIMAWVATQPPEVKSATGENQKLLAIDRARLRTIELEGPRPDGQDGERRTIRLKREGEGKPWVVASHWDHPVRAELVERFLKMLDDVRRGELMSDKTDALDKHGLDAEARRTIRFFGVDEDEPLTELVIGKTYKAETLSEGGPGPGAKNDSMVYTDILFNNQIRRTPTDLVKPELPADKGADPVFERDYLKPIFWLDPTIHEFDKEALRQLVIVVPKADGSADVTRLARYAKSALEGSEPEEGDKELVWRRAEIDRNGEIKELHKVNEATLSALLYTLEGLKGRDVAKPIIQDARQRGPSEADTKRLGLEKMALQIIIGYGRGEQIRLLFTKVKDGEGEDAAEKAYCIVPDAAKDVKVDIKGKITLDGKKKQRSEVRIPVFLVDVFDIEDLSKKPDDFKIAEPEDKKDPKDKPADPKDKPADPKDKPADPKDKPADPKDKPADPKDKPADPKDKPADPKDKPADPKDKPADPKDKPADKPADAKDKPADPKDKPADKPEGDAK